MRTCPRCNTSYPDDARFCPEDGVQLVVPGDGNDPHIGKVLLRQFEIREICGKGSMGTVYRAWQESMERDVAVKILRRDLLRDEKVVKRFHREARAAARLSHANIITVYLVGDTDDGLPFIVMEYVTGVSLDQACNEAGPMPAVRAIHIAQQIAAALTEAHSHHIVHRDLKPENILLSSRKNSPDLVKVLDFGIAKILYANDEPLTQTGAIFGTPHYVAPEQASGSDIDHRCDLYALGVILFRMLTGRLPFESESGMEVLIQHLREQPPHPRDLVPTIPQPLEAVVLRCLEKDVERRFQSGEALNDALAGVVAGLSGSTRELGNSKPDRAYPTTISAPAAPGPNDSDPRFHVPGDRTLASLTPTENDIADPLQVEPSLPARRNTEPTEVVAPPRDPVVLGSTTVGLAAAVTGRRSVLFHLLVGLAVIGGGSAVGAAAHWVRQPPDRAIESPPEPDFSQPVAIVPDGPAVQAPTPDATVTQRDKTPERPRRPRPPRGKRPSTHVDRVDSHSPTPLPIPKVAPQPDASPAEPEPEIRPTEPETKHPGKDDFYDLVD